MSPTPDRFVALLRGINVGGKNSLSMKTLAAMFDAQGCQNVRTYIQSGNVVFEASPKLADEMPASLRRELERLGLTTNPVVIRSSKQWHDVITTNPFLRENPPTASLHVGFLAQTPGRDAGAKLDPNRSPPDRFVLQGSELFLHCPDGLGRSKLTNDYFEKRLESPVTIRNWNTVLALGKLLNEAP